VDLHRVAQLLNPQIRCELLGAREGGRRDDAVDLPHGERGIVDRLARNAQHQLDG
jgi:hypothetical protein